MGNTDTPLPIKAVTGSAAQQERSRPSATPRSIVATTVKSDTSEPVQIVGSAEITFFLFEDYLVEPFVMLEDQAGDRKSVV